MSCSGTARFQKWYDATCVRPIASNKLRKGWLQTRAKRGCICVGAGPGSIGPAWQPGTSTRSKVPELRPHNANLCIFPSAAAAKASRKSACFCAAIAERGMIAEQAGLISHMSEFHARRRSIRLPTYAIFSSAPLQLTLTRG